MLSYRVDGKRLIASTPVMPRGGGRPAPNPRWIVTFGSRALIFPWHLVATGELF